MIKQKAITSNSGYEKDHSEEVDSFLKKIDSKGHSFISLGTIAFVNNDDGDTYLRTEIVYRENQIRKVLVEKQGS